MCSNILHSTESELGRAAAYFIDLTFRLLLRMDGLLTLTWNGKQLKWLRPILTHGSEFWTVTSAANSKIQVAEMRLLRLIKGRKRFPNKNIRKKLNVESILRYVEETQLRWFGYVKQMPSGRTAHLWLQLQSSTTTGVDVHGNIGWKISRRRW